MKYVYSGTTDVGFARTNNEDFVHVVTLTDDCVLSIIADGTGSEKEQPKPASIIAVDIADYICDVYKEKPDLLLAEPLFFLKHAMRNANKLMGAFKMGNDDMYRGYAASVTCAFCTPDKRVYIAHAGNTRFYLVRDKQLKQLTQDNTEAWELMKEGKITEDMYVMHPGKLKMTSGIGIVTEPYIRTFSLQLKSSDILCMTTDGIHYALNPEGMTEIILNSANIDDAAANLIRAAKDIIKHPDNMACILLNTEEDK